MAIKWEMGHREVTTADEAGNGFATILSHTLKIGHANLLKNS